ncbi:DMT family transporter [Acinetobacter junii]|uniref:DMT family transporter n=1 Tax=Acinetobacter junii TaxID=40215 RepID=UPI00095084F2|nr:DMT family transporter [Acinetobacter junii]APU47703.1 EamA family transporter [Acinetobacter junii]MCU4408037.1 DMT family transporter [Acinetobacter junii]TID63559.1 EamA/RhaT family transporter [Acinetobacter junii]TIE04308.1 EamA/RhaT family transporter [Acinetobacter junii]
MNVLLYALVVVIWGTTWIAITLQQQSEISTTVAVFWRFFISAIVLFAFVVMSRKLQKLATQDHLFCLLQACCIFGFNFVCFYYAVQYISSGLEAVIFSMAVIFNTINAKVFFAQQISSRFYPAALFGLFGIIALFWHDVMGTALNSNTLIGIGLCILGTYGFSLGNMISTHHQKHELDIFTTNAYAMLYGSLLMALISWFKHDNFFPSMSGSSVSALLYLAIFGSVIGFTAYFYLVGRIGAGKAAYSTLLFPLVALVISTIWEGYHWQMHAVIGVILILCGNAIFFIKLPRFRAIKTS